MDELIILLLNLLFEYFPFQGVKLPFSVYISIPELIMVFLLITICAILGISLQLLHQKATLFMRNADHVGVEIVFVDDRRAYC